MMTHAQRSAGRQNGPVDPVHPGWSQGHIGVPRSAEHRPPPGYGPAPGYGPPSDYGPPPGYGPPPEPGYGPPAGAYRRLPEPPPEPPAPEPVASAPSAAAGEPEVEAPRRDDRWWADLRQQVVYRCTRFNSGHIHAADERYGTREALGPHGVMLFFTSDAPTEPQGFRLHTAFRLFLAAPESNDLRALLADLAGIVKGNIAHAKALRRSWHPLGPERSMVNGGDMTLPPDATYAGAGVSTLDSDDGSWYQLAQTLRNPSGGYRRSAFDLKGRCYVLLTDDTAIQVDRDPHARSGNSGVRSSRPLEPNWNPHWHNPHKNLTEQGDYAIREVWRQLASLHGALKHHLCEEPAA